VSAILRVGDMARLSGGDARLTGRYIYQDTDGTELYAKLRFAIPGGGKTFRFGLRVGTDDAWLISSVSGLANVPYRLPELIAGVRAAKTIYLAEGEKDVHRLVELGEVATTARDGASRGAAKYPPGFFGYLGGASVVVIADRDKDGTGLSHGRTALAGLQAAGCRDAALFLPSRHVNPGGKADLSDHLDAGYGLADLEPAPAEGEEAVILDAAPDYPVSALTGPLREFAEWAMRDGLHAETAGPAGLAALTSVCGDARLTVGSMQVPPTLWSVNIGPASSGKSPALRHAFEPVRKLDADAMARWDELLQLWRDDPASVKDKGPAPSRPPLFLTKNVTLESYLRKLNKAGGSLTIACDELEAFLSSLGQYRQSGGNVDRAVFRELWTGDPVDYVRVGDSGSDENRIDIHISQPVAPIYGPLLPEDVDKLGSVSRGDTARWLPSRAPSAKPRLNDHPEPKPESWGRVIGQLAAKRDQLREWHLTGHAYEMWRRARDRWAAEADSQDEPTPEHVTEPLKKADSQCARVALVLAESLYPGGSPTMEIPAEAMHAAIAIVDYSMDCWRSLPGGPGFAVTRAAARYSEAVIRLLHWLERRPSKMATRRQIQQAKIAGITKPGDLDALIDEYGQHFPGCADKRTPPGGGRIQITVRYPITRIRGNPHDVDPTSPGSPPYPDPGEDKSSSQSWGVSGEGQNDVGNSVSNIASNIDFPTSSALSEVTESETHRVVQSEVKASRADTSGRPLLPGKRTRHCQVGGCRSAQSAEYEDGMRYCDRHAKMMGARPVAGAR
jgi:hypothetical protein